MKWRFGFRGLALLLVAVAFAASCGDDAVGSIPAVGQLPVTADPAAIAPTSAHGVSSVAAGETPAFTRHNKSIPPNRGNQYVYGELSLSGNCLRISYVDQADREGTRDGLLVVWPMGFDVRISDGVVEVTEPGDDVVAAEGQAVRLSGKKVSRQSAAIEAWDWDGGEVGHCSGPYWLVGDEVTAMGPGAMGPPPADGIFLPRLGHQRGPIVSPVAGVEGRLTLRGRCLLVETSYSPGEHLFVVWPPGFNVRRTGDDLFVVNGGGSVIAKVGDDVTLGGSSGRAGADYSDECPGAYFAAYSVQRSPAE